ncbi:MAG: RNA-binding S4 domain-containing protein [Prevotellaceae bacterium]|jgi:ribosome-associated heat shock protein Hsp15|nr:RNA-binding S4 domain-containing protein [Prevotellaceae bacterium]
MKKDISEQNTGSKRIDKWLWAVRIFKTRSDAVDACKRGCVSVNNTEAKPSREIKAGDTITVKKMPVIYTFKVLGLIQNRQPAKNVPLYAENITPQEELDKLQVKHTTIFVQRDRGAGRPTKKERRTLDELMNSFMEDDDE